MTLVTISAATPPANPPIAAPHRFAAGVLRRRSSAAKIANASTAPSTAAIHPCMPNGLRTKAIEAAPASSKMREIQALTGRDGGDATEGVAHLGTCGVHV